MTEHIRLKGTYNYNPFFYGYRVGKNIHENTVAKRNFLYIEKKFGYSCKFLMSGQYTQNHNTPGNNIPFQKTQYAKLPNTRIPNVNLSDALKPHFNLPNARQPY